MKAKKSQGSHLYQTESPAMDRDLGDELLPIYNQLNPPVNMQLSAQSTNSRLNA